MVVNGSSTIAPSYTLRGCNIAIPNCLIQPRMPSKHALTSTSLGVRILKTLVRE